MVDARVCMCGGGACMMMSVLFLLCGRSCCHTGVTAVVCCCQLRRYPMTAKLCESHGQESLAHMCVHKYVVLWYSSNTCRSRAALHRSLSGLLLTVFPDSEVKLSTKVRKNQTNS